MTNNNEKNLTVIINPDSCGGECDQFCDWIRSSYGYEVWAYPTTTPGIYNADNELVEDTSRLWNEYCRG